MNDPLMDLHKAYMLLKEQGWKDAVHCPVSKGKPVFIEVIELGSCGIHNGWRDDLGFWVADDADTYPSNPILWRPAERKAVGE